MYMYSYMPYTCMHAPAFLVMYMYSYTAYTCIQSCIFMQNFSPKTGSPRSVKNFSMVEHKVESRKSKVESRKSKVVPKISITFLKSCKVITILINLVAKVAQISFLRIISLYRGSIYKSYTQKLFFSYLSY